MIIKDFVLFNPKGKKPTDYVNYIDTSSVEDGKLIDIQRLSDNIPSRAQRVIEEGDILISSVRPILKHNYYVSQHIENGIASTGFIQIRADRSKVIPQYLYYFLTEENKVKMYQTIAETSQSTFPSFNKDVIENMAFPDVSLAEQQHIVDILGTLDEKIENNEKNIALMLQLCKEKFSLLSSQSNIKTTLKNLCEFAICGTTPSTKAPELWNGNIPFITTPDMNNKVFVFDTERTVAYSDKIKSKLISEDSISVSCIGTIGVIGMATELSLTNQQINTLIPRTNQKYYLYNLLLANIDAIKAIATGSATPNISKESFLKLDVYVCSEKDICSFNEDVTPIYETIKKLQIENRKIKELKQLYLKKFFG